MRTRGANKTSLTRGQRYRRRLALRKSYLRDTRRRSKCVRSRSMYRLYNHNRLMTPKSAGLIELLNQVARNKISVRKDAIKYTQYQSASMFMIEVFLPPCSICGTALDSRFNRSDEEYDSVPLYLPCGHEVCVNCSDGIQAYTCERKVSDNEEYNGWPCPFCRKTIQECPRSLPPRPCTLDIIYRRLTYTCPVLDAHDGDYRGVSSTILQKMYRSLEKIWGEDQELLRTELEKPENENIKFLHGTCIISVRLRL